MMKLRTLLAALGLAAAHLAAHAQPPSLPSLIRIVVPFSAGASTDVIARAVAQQLGPRLGTNVIVENRAGGAGMVGASVVAKGPKDGSMLLLTSVSMVSNAATSRNPAVDVLGELVPVSMLGESPLVVAVSAKTEIRTPADLLAAARARPDQLTHGTSGAGTIAHLAAEMLNDAASIQLKHIPYKGTAGAVIDASAGTIDIVIAANTTFASQVQGGRLRQVAVTSPEPSAAFPGLPTLASVVPGYSASLWTAVFVPAGTPAALVERLNREINAVAQSKALADLMQGDGGMPLAVDPQGAARIVRDSYATWKRVATTRSISLE